jgi:exosome complex component RRP42
MVQCDVIPINFDGNVLDIGGLATLAALLNARFPAVDKDGKADYHKSTDKTLSLQRYPLPITIGKIGGYLLVDPTQEEEKALDARVTITVLEDGSICAMQKGLPAPITKDEFKEMVTLAQAKSEELRTMLFEVTKK